MMPIMIITIIFDIIFLDIDPALANAIIVFSMLLLILIFNKENIIEIFQVVINFPTTSKVPIKRRFQQSKENHMRRASVRERFAQ